MILFGYFLDAILTNTLIKINIIPCFTIIISYFIYLKRKKLDYFFLEIGISSFFAYLLFYKNFLFDFSYFILAYTIIDYFFKKSFNKIIEIRNIIFLIVGYYLYEEIYLFFLQSPIPIISLIIDILKSIPLNIFISFLLLNIIGIKRKKVNKI